ncbi:adhesion G protein-coupled receptor E2-like [Cloeon dipterum]|uniref:adhesion G protein-coupled receptor E2-like n=1 Tax=Cloeon dipterum TaxID=197152 RepID=UPI00322014FC
MFSCRVVVLVFFLTMQQVWESHEAALKEKCDKSESCVTGNSSCADGVCECNDGYVMDSQSKICLLSVKSIGQELCIDSLQCPESSSCSEIQGKKTCNCKKDFVKNTQGSACLQVSTKLGQVCQENDQCKIDNSICKVGKCSCNEDAPIETKNECLKSITSIDNENCKDDMQCPGSSTCVGNQGNMTCKCIPGFVKNSRGSACLKEIRTLGGRCEDPNECKIENSICKAGICTCKEEAPFGISDECLKNVKSIGNEKCKNNIQCPNNSTCSEGNGDKTCNCVAGFVRNAQSSACLEGAKKVGDECVESNQCTLNLKNSLCKTINASQTCECNNGFVLNTNKSECLKVVALGEECTESVQCIRSQKCLNEKCSCDTVTHVPHNNTCLEKKHVGEPCSDKVQCFLDGGQNERTNCVREVCTCSEPFRQDPGKNACISGVRKAAASFLVTIYLLLVKIIF